MRAAVALTAVGWGANQFAAMLPVYQDVDGATSSEVTLLFGAYAAGLIPTLLVVAPLSDRWGRRRVMLPVLVLSLAATVVLMVGGHHLWLLLVGRVLAGIASGAAFAPGTAWVKELSDGPAGTGARRAAVAMTAGFGTGPLVSGVVAQWGPAPTVLPYVPHLVLAVVALWLVRVAPESPRPVGSVSPDGEARVGQALASAPFLRRVVPTAPWVFGCASLGFTTVPAIAEVPGPRVAVGGFLVALTLGTGILVQPLGRRWASTTTLLLGVGAGVLGFVLAIGAAATGVAAFTVLAAVPLGAAYGWILVGGLTTVEEVAPPQHLARVTSVFYSLTYLGFAAPFLGTVLLDLLRPVPAMGLLAVLLALCAAPALGVRGPRRPPPGPERDRPAA